MLKKRIEMTKKPVVADMLFPFLLEDACVFEDLLVCCEKLLAVLDG
jgi:hypothetical protein